MNKMKTLIQKDKYTQIFTIAIFTMTKIQKQHKCLLTHEWIRSIWYVYIYIMLYYSTIKKNEICPFSVNLDKLENTRLSEKSQRKTDTKYVSLICGI